MSESQQQPGTIGWRDLTVPDAAKVRDFYQAVVGWKSEEYCGDFNMLSQSTSNIA